MVMTFGCGPGRVGLEGRQGGPSGLHCGKHASSSEDPCQPAARSQPMLHDPTCLLRSEEPAHRRWSVVLNLRWHQVHRCRRRGSRVHRARCHGWESGTNAGCFKCLRSAMNSVPPPTEESWTSQESFPCLKGAGQSSGGRAAASEKRCRNAKNSRQYTTQLQR